MRSMTITLLALAAFAATADIASARDGCGNGRFWNGNRCASIGARYDAPRSGYNYGYNAYSRNRSACPPHYSVQDGVCKPYRGY